MKKLFIGVLLTAIVAALASSCGMKVKTVEPYLISIDSLYAPDTVKIKTLFDVEVFGLVGPSKCYAFERLYSSGNNNNEIFIEAWGNYTYVGDPCVDEKVLLQESIEISVSVPGIYTLKGLKYNSNYSEKTLVVI
jgi:hypothetical protein